MQALKNLQIVLQVFLSGFFEGCLDLFILDLERSQRPMELVAADFLLYLIEELLCKIFRVIRSERSSTSLEEVPVSTPEECAAYLGPLFSRLSAISCRRGRLLSHEINSRGEHRCQNPHAKEIAREKGGLADAAMRRTPGKAIEGYLS